MTSNQAITLVRVAKAVGGVLGYKSTTIVVERDVLPPLADIVQQIRSVEHLASFKFSVLPVGSRYIYIDASAIV